MKRNALRRLAWALPLAGALALPAGAETNTVQILTKTIAAMPSCLAYQVKGVCFFLSICGSWPPYPCIKTSIRISHYVPDAIVSTYHDPAHHPWSEIGKPLAEVSSSLGSAMMSMPLDSSASTQRTEVEVSTFKSADAIGNPAGMILQILSTQSMPSLPDSFAAPGLTELMAFPTQELPKIQQQWLSAPSVLGNTILSDAAKMAQAPGDLLGKLQSGIGNAGGILSKGIDIGDLSSISSQLGGIDLGPLQEVSQIASAAVSASGNGSGAYFCPGSASAFSLHFLSDIDSLFWRETIPLELLYPASWVPTMGEVSTSPAISTWGGMYPRTGQLVQPHPVKASAVYASRVGSIITKTAQPHIYTPLKPGSGFKYFDPFADTRWQMLSPSSTGCIQFGSNDSTGLSSFGDGKTDPADGYTWNMWNKYDCCQERGSFLFSVP